MSKTCHYNEYIFECRHDGWYHIIPTIVKCVGILDVNLRRLDDRMSCAMDTVEVFSRRLRELRRQKGISQVELANAVGIGRSTLAEYETGRITPTITVAAVLARYFGVSADYLLGLTDNPQPWKNDLPETVKRQLEEYYKLKERYQNLVDKILKIAEDVKKNG